MQNETIRLAICWPWSLDNTPTRFVDSALNLQRPADCEIRWVRGLGDTAARRHVHCMEQALGWKADAILILGADQVYHDPEMLVKLVGHYRNGYEAVTALVPMRGVTPSQGTKPFQLIGFRRKPDKDGNVVNDGDMRAELFEPITRADGPLVRCHAVGSGVLLFPASALAKVDEPWFKEARHPISQQRLTCGDTDFVGRLQKAGYELWCDTTVKVTHLQVMEIDDTFPDRFADWGWGVGDQFLVESVPAADDRKITQARVSPCIPFYRDRFLKRYGLAPYHNPFTPAIFFGCYDTDDLKAIQDHQSIAVVVWAGTDALQLRKALEGEKRYPFGENVYHVAISKFIADDLDSLQWPYKRVPFCNVDEEKFKPVPRGRAVYCYCPEGNGEKYGESLLKEVMERMPETEFIIQKTLDPNADMVSIYEKCGIGLRLTEHDGLSNTVVELGLMGRDCIWNGDTPNAKNYETVDDIVNLIKLSEFGSNTMVDHVAKLTREYISLGDNWRNADEYKPMEILSKDLLERPYNYAEYFDFRYGQGPTGAGGPDPKSPENRWTQNAVLELLDKHKCKTVTEIGCGAMVRWDALPCMDYIGLDVSTTALKYAKEKFPEGIFEQCDITQCGPNPADAILCIDVLQHIKKEDIGDVLRKLLAAANKVLIIKTSVGIGERFYQYSHPWEELSADAETIRVPGVPCSRIFVFEKGTTNANLRTVEAGTTHETAR